MRLWAIIVLLTSVSSCRFDECSALGFPSGPSLVVCFILRGGRVLFLGRRPSLAARWSSFAEPPRCDLPRPAAGGCKGPEGARSSIWHILVHGGQRVLEEMVGHEMRSTSKLSLILCSTANSAGANPAWIPAGVSFRSWEPLFLEAVAHCAARAVRLLRVPSRRRIPPPIRHQHPSIRPSRHALQISLRHGDDVERLLAGNTPLVLCRTARCEHGKRPY